MACIQKDISIIHLDTSIPLVLQFIECNLMPSGKNSFYIQLFLTIVHCQFVMGTKPALWFIYEGVG